jgi:hypothetical protein
VGRPALRRPPADRCAEVLLEQRLLQRLPQLRQLQGLLRRLRPRHPLRHLVLMRTSRVCVCACSEWATIVVSSVRDICKYYSGDVLQRTTW